MVRIVSNKPSTTQAVAGLLALEAYATMHDSAIVVALLGELGAGKTTFTQGFAEALGIKDRIASPTFVLMKIYQIHKKSRREVGAEKRQLVHIDCYRIEKLAELRHLELEKSMADRNIIMLIEWADRIWDSLPQDSIVITMEHGSSATERIITVSTKKELAESSR